MFQNDNEKFHYICRQCKENVQNSFEFKCSLINVNNKHMEAENLERMIDKQVSDLCMVEKCVEKPECVLCKKLYDKLTVISTSKILDDNMKVALEYIPEIVSDILFLLEHIV